MGLRELVSCFCFPIVSISQHFLALALALA